MTLEVYAPDGPVTLFLNGQEAARGTAQNNFALFDIVYQSRELRAECAGGRFSLYTASPAHHLTSAVEAPCMPQGEELWGSSMSVSPTPMDACPFAAGTKTASVRSQFLFIADPFLLPPSDL